MWHKITERPKDGKKILVVSPIYPVGHEMRVRIIDSQFFTLCKEIEKWAYVEELENTVSVSQVGEVIIKQFASRTSGTFCGCCEGDIEGKYINGVIDFKEDVLAKLRE